jgi:hypothetical protein
MPRRPSVPSLRRHKPTRQGVVTLNKQDHYLGVWPDGEAEAVKARYDALVAEWLTAARTFAQAVITSDK